MDDPRKKKGLHRYHRVRDLMRLLGSQHVRIGHAARGGIVAGAIPAALLGAWAAVIVSSSAGPTDLPRQAGLGAPLAAQEGQELVRRFFPLLAPDSMAGQAPVALSMPSPPEKSQFWALALEPDRDLLLAGDAENGLRIFDISRPSNPRELSRIQPFASGEGGRAEARVTDVEIEWPYAYVSLSGNGTAVVDISDPRAPFQVAAPGPPPPGLQTLALASWNRLLVRGPLGGLHVYDIARRSDPKRLQHFFPWRPGSNECPPASGLDQLSEHEEVAYYVRGCDFTVLELNADSWAIETRHVELELLAWDSALAHDLDRLYVGGDFGGLEVFDVSSPGHPTRVTTVSEADFPFWQFDTSDDGFGVAWIGHGRFTPVDLRNVPSVVVGPTVEIGGDDRLAGEVVVHGDVAFVMVALAYSGDQRELRVYDGIESGQTRLLSRIR